MPIFDWRCGSCDHTAEEYRKIGESAPVENCPVCGKLEYIKQIGLPSTDRKAFSKPIEMYSVALDTDEEIKAVRDKCPDVKISMDQNDEMYGIPIAKTRNDKLKVLKAMGYVEKS